MQSAKQYAFKNNGTLIANILWEANRGFIVFLPPLAKQQLDDSCTGGGGKKKKNSDFFFNDMQLPA